MPDIRILDNSRIIQITADGSYTLLEPSLNVTYHSKFGAIQESKHIFIQQGLLYFLQMNAACKNETVSVFEIGFGTGLNALLSLHEAIQQNQNIYYETIEPHPITTEEAKALNYVSVINSNLETGFHQLHVSSWNESILINALFRFKKTKVLLQDFSTTNKFHIIFFDAFDPTAQPELWTEAIFKKLFQLLHNKGILVTYSSKGIIRSALKIAGFKVEKLKGPPGKREIVRAVKL